MFVKLFYPRPFPLPFHETNAPPSNHLHFLPFLYAIMCNDAVGLPSGRVHALFSCIRKGSGFSFSSRSWLSPFSLVHRIHFHYDLLFPPSHRRSPFFFSSRPPYAPNLENLQTRFPSPKKQVVRFHVRTLSLTLSRLALISDVFGSIPTCQKISSAKEFPSCFFIPEIFFSFRVCF